MINPIFQMTRLRLRKVKYIYALCPSSHSQAIRKLEMKPILPSQP